ncbi:MAG TPA: NAD(P)H-dependent oxidoreductase [Candidatus Limosilactobacillus merdipullorum]|uniref:NAD(P)H-dependent oxidoreductase n=1 Tax=Candidatus Limosilactobacillus merdipullorum TaxID=2838653 RepID=A0A9D1QM50_9LACO|nr:NAD(P)H-dependent oxidoreductase [Candidatus Limosilactobacillus merdipullorum]
MKVVAIGGSSAPQSYNLMLLNYMKKHFPDLKMSVFSVRGLPLFNEDDSLPDSLKDLSDQIDAADAVIIASPEYNHSVTSALKSVMEWLSTSVHPLHHKPVMLVGASTHVQGSARSQIHLRDILLSPGIQAFVFSGEEFFLGNCRDAFDEQGDLKDEGTVKFLEQCVREFGDFANVVNRAEKEATE